MGIRDRLAHAWNAFTGQTEETAMVKSYGDFAVSYGHRQSLTRLTVANERSIISSVMTRMSMDAAAVAIRHVRLDEEGRYMEDMVSGLNECLDIEANVDQSGTELRQDGYLTMLDKGVACVVPVDTTINPRVSGGFDIKSLRVGEIVQWYPQHVKVDLYNEKQGKREHVVLEKKFCAIPQNPLYHIMNEPNSTLQRLIRKLNLLDVVDEQSSSGKLDIIIQLPYTIKSEARRQQAEQRRKDIEFQLAGSQYGIAYADATEKITQLNRPAENNLLKQVEYLHNLLFAQLGITEDILNGTATPEAMQNYYERTVAPLVTAMVEAMRRAYLTKTARSQRQTVMYFKDPFKLVTISDLAEAADKLTRNKIVTANEMRVVIGFKPVKDPGADKLVNANMPAEKDPAQQSKPAPSEPGTNQQQEGNSQNGS